LPEKKYSDVGKTTDHKPDQIEHAINELKPNRLQYLVNDSDFGHFISLHGINFIFFV